MTTNSRCAELTGDGQALLIVTELSWKKSASPERRLSLDPSVLIFISYLEVWCSRPNRCLQLVPVLLVLVDLLKPNYLKYGTGREHHGVYIDFSKTGGQAVHCIYSTITQFFSPIQKLLPHLSNKHPLIPFSEVQALTPEPNSSSPPIPFTNTSHHSLISTCYNNVYK